MKNKISSLASQSFPKVRALLVMMAIIGMAIFLLPGYVSDHSVSETGTTDSSVENQDTKISSPKNQSDPRIRLRENFHSSFEKDGRASLDVSATTAPNTSTINTRTSEPLRQEAYLAALMEMMEAEGRDNALIHYALAFEMAPPAPTPEQAILIKMVLDEGWDERAEPLLPYLLAWQEAFEKLHHGASLNYARGIGFEMGANTPVPDFLRAQSASKMLAVYSRYLESQGNGAKAAEQINTVLAMGRDFNSPDNFLISNLIGTSMESTGLRQLNHLVSSNVLTPSQLQATVDRLRYIEQGQPAIQAVIDTEMHAVLVSIQQAMESADGNHEQFRTDPATAQLIDGETVVPLEDYEEEYRKLWASLSEKFSTPYWERGATTAADFATELEDAFSVAAPNIAEAEVRFLNITSRLRQQQIDVAAQRYMADFQNPPRDINTLVSRNYLPAAPVDPFTGGPFTYAPTENGYHLYGSGPDISSPIDPGVDWNPVNGTFSQGVIRTR